MSIPNPLARIPKPLLKDLKQPGRYVPILSLWERPNSKADSMVLVWAANSDFKPIIASLQTSFKRVQQGPIVERPLKKLRAHTRGP